VRSVLAENGPSALAWADIDFPAVIGGDRVQLAMAHGDLIKIILIALL
jgi:hypothetical protein